MIVKEVHDIDIETLAQAIMFDLGANQLGQLGFGLADVVHDYAPEPNWSSLSAAEHNEVVSAVYQAIF